MGCLKSAAYTSLEQREPMSTLNHLRGRKSSFQKRTKFSQGNNVLDAPPCNTRGFLSRDVFVSST
jgi:hypothetical protein